MNTVGSGPRWYCILETMYFISAKTRSQFSYVTPILTIAYAVSATQRNTNPCYHPLAPLADALSCFYFVDTRKCTRGLDGKITPLSHDLFCSYNVVACPRVRVSVFVSLCSCLCVRVSVFVSTCSCLRVRVLTFVAADEGKDL